jgi:transposase
MGTAKRRGRAGHRTGISTAEIETRRERAINLRIEGQPYREIAKLLGVSLSQARSDVEAVLERTREHADETAQRMRKISLERLDRLTRGLMPKADRGDSRAAEVIAKIEERRAKLVGMDAPEKRELTGADGTPLVATPAAAAAAVREIFRTGAVKPADDAGG